MKNQIIGSSDIMPKAEGTKPFRFVLRFLGAESATPYVVHMETLKPDGSHDGFHHGHYLGNMLEGHTALLKRAERYNLAVCDVNGKLIPAAAR